MDIAHSNPSVKALQVRELVKTFGKGPQAVHALRGLSLDVEPGIVYTILGPNGAGKTTLIRILTTLTRPDSGTVLLNGIDVMKNPLQARQSLGVVFQKNNFNKYLNVWQNLSLHAQQHGLTNYKPLIESLLEQVGMLDRKNAMPDALSGGQQRRLSLIRALMHQPKVLFLDEPSTGLDPEARQSLWQMLEALKAHQQTTLILTTHYMEEAEALSDRILMMHHGQRVMEGTPDELKGAFGPKNWYQIKLNRPYAQHYKTKLLLAGKVTEAVASEPTVLQVQTQSPEGFKAVLAQIEARDLKQAGQMMPSLETLFLKMAREGLLADTPEATAPSLKPNLQKQ